MTYTTIATTPAAGLRLPAVLAVLALAATLAACRGNTAAPAPAVSADTWATVDGREIKRDDVEKAYRRVGSGAPSEEEALTAKLALLDDMIVQDILVARAAVAKVEVTPAELDAAYAEARKNISDADFTQELSRRNLTSDDMREGLRREMLVQKLMERDVVSKVSVAEQEVADFYAANRAQFNFPEEAYHIAQIVVTADPAPQPVNRTGNDAATAQQASAKLQMLLERLKGGASFSELAADYSEDPQTAPRGGDLGLVPISALRRAPQPLRDAVLKAEPGTVNVVSSQDGGHTIVLLVAKEAAGQRELKDPSVQQRVTALLQGRKEQLLRAAYLGAARNEAVVVNHIARRLVESQGKMPAFGPTAPGTP